MMSSMLPFILLSALVTYLPRLFPFLLKGLDRLPKKVGKFLKLMPLAALGALIFPGVLLDFQPVVLAGIGGITLAAVIAWFRGGMILPILSSIVMTFTLLQIFG